MSELSCQALIYLEKQNKIDKLWQFQDQIWKDNF